ncbi:MAG: glycosyltransferase, partial [Gammaproteobacteria bacterium]|nr:glycosyltransferase [Gammaproteobacteria bacterium]
FGAAARLPGIVARLRRGRFDVAMIYFVDSNLYLVPACRMAGIPAVVINRRDMGYWYEPGLLRTLNFVNRLATHFLVNAEAVKEQVIRHEHFAPGSITVIPNGIWDMEERCRRNSGEMDPPPDGFPLSGPVVGITASLREVKRIDRFLDVAAEVMRSVPEARFVIAGQGRLRDELQEHANALGLDRAVTFLGHVSDVPSLLRRLHVGVLTSESEGLSNSLVEYGLAGIPTVAFDVGGNAEVVRDGETGFLVPPGDTAAMARQVIRLLTDASLHAGFSRAAREYCETVFAPDHVREITLRFFSSLIGTGFEETDGAPG